MNSKWDRSIVDSVTLVVAIFGTAVVMAIGVIWSDTFADERSEVEKLAPKFNARSEVRLWDNSRVDMLTDKHAIEVDYAPKWAEGIGQSLYYAIICDRKPGLVLLAKPEDERFLLRAQAVCAKHDITLWVVRVNDDKSSDGNE